MNRNVERGQATRTHLVEVATQLFAAHGYEGTSIEAVLAESGASRGSLYHHFAGKNALFLAVLEDVGTLVTAQVTEAMRDGAGGRRRSGGRAAGGLAGLDTAGRRSGHPADRADRRADRPRLAALAG